MTLKLWLDDYRQCPKGWTHAHSVNDAIRLIEASEGWEAASLDHDLGEYADDGGDGFRLVLWMIENDRWPSYRPNVHSANPVGAKRMRQDIDRYFPLNRC